MKILLTGASGFLGSALARHFAAQGHALTLLLRPTSSLRRLRGLEARCRVARCADDDEIGALVRELRPDAVIHTACAYGRRGETPLQLLDANLRVGLVLLQSLLDARAAEPVTFIHTGSVLAPEVSLYALSKAQFADWGRALAAAHPDHLRFVDVRLQHMYGPDDDASKFTTSVLHACHDHVAALALTAGEQRRDFVFIDDVVEAYETLLRRAPELASSESIDVGSGTAPTVREFVETVHALCRSKTRLDFGAQPYRPNEAMHCQADLTRMRQLGWTPQYDLRSGLLRTIELEFDDA